MANHSRTHLTLYLTSGYALLILYASLYPLAGWHDSGGDSLAFLGAAWPRYYTGFDLATNIIAYLPFGFFCTAPRGWASKLKSAIGLQPAWNGMDTL